jgi:NADPH:quinone reductase-like Zn-dependent oxidoreductase
MASNFAKSPFPCRVQGAGEVLVRIRANSLNFRDLAVLQGWLPFGAQAGRVPLSDAAGVIEAIGKRVTRFAVGNHVVNSIMLNWFGGSFQAIPQQYGIHLDGWLREYRVVSEQELVIMPSFLSFTEAATLPCAAVTAWSAWAGVGPGKVVLTQGTGGVSLLPFSLRRLRVQRLSHRQTSLCVRLITGHSPPFPAAQLQTRFISSPTGVGA